MRYYLDTEFFDLNNSIISLALVSEARWGELGKEYGKELYVACDQKELEAEAKIVTLESERRWVRDNVLPIIDITGARAVRLPRVGRSEINGLIAAKVATYLAGDPEPIIVTDWPSDIKYLCEIMITGPGKMIETPPLIRWELHRVDAYPTKMPDAIQHNALWDARALRYKLTGK